jgi:spermidine/putrescine ABC transporter ATP-binding subunit
VAEPNRSAGIRLAHISATFHQRERGDIVAVRDIDLDVKPSELLTLLGPSGCGKTTVLRMIAGFQEPSAGEIFIGERNVTGVPANKRDIGFVFQTYALFPHLTVFENVAYGLRVRQWPESEINTAVEDVLKLVGLGGFGGRLPNELSGGQQQRVALARAIVIRPHVLLFDEPLSNLDAKLRVEMRGEIQKLHRRLGITTVYVTHDQEEAMAISDRIAVMESGSIAQIGTAEDLYRRPVSAFVASFIGRANMLHGVARETVGGRLTLDLAGQAVRLPTTVAIPVGSRVTAVVRPESISIAAAGEGLRAKVTGRVYLGNKVEYTVRLGEENLEVVRSDPPEAENFASGQEVAIGLPTEGVQLLIDAPPRP